MNDKGGSPLYLEITPGINIRELLNNALEKYRNVPDFKRDYINFIIENGICDFLDGKIILSESLNHKKFKLTGFPLITTEMEFLSVKNIFEVLFKNISSPDYSDLFFPPSAFFRKGDTVAEISMEDNSPDYIASYFAAADFHAELSGSLHTYKARESGYLILDNSRFRLLSPFKISDNNTSLSVVFIPVIYQKKELLEYIYNFHSNFVSRYPEAPLLEIPERSFLENSGPLCFETIKGRTTVEGKDAELIMNNVDGIPEDLPYKTDYRSFRKYKVIKENELLLKKIRKIQCESGLDIYGNTIVPEEGEDIEIIAGENIRFEEEDRIVSYYAMTAGVFTFDGKNVSVDEVMIINSNVDYSTGNIDFPKSILIKGDVLYGFNVKSGKDIIVEGCLEKGVFLKCTGDLIVKRGIIGKETRVECGGDVFVNYFNDAELYSKGKTVVEKSLIGGAVFSEKSIEVHGAGIKSSSTFGGEYYTMGRIILHSAGNANRETLLCCGYNPYIDYKHKEAVKACAALDIEMSKITGLLINKYNISEKKGNLKNLSSGVKEKVLEELKKLKKLTESRKKIDGVRQSLEKKIYSSDSRSLSIEIMEHITPVVNIQIIHDSQVITEKTGPKVF